MSTLATPSAKSHEQVTGRWSRDLHAETKQDWVVYYAKLIVGSPVPWIFAGFLISLFISRAAVEVCAWVTSLLTLCYIIADRFARDREFEFTRVGSDLFLLGFLITAIAGVTQASSVETAWHGIGVLRWIPLLYLFLYTWQLFPGLNRMFQILMGTASGVAIYAIVQHFVGQDFVRQATLEYAPLKGFSYSIVTGFFSRPEILGTMLALVLPLPVAAFMQASEHERSLRWPALLMTLLLATAIFWTYKPGLWTAAAAGIAITMILQSRRHFALILTLAVFFGGLIFACYGSYNTLITQVAEAELSRATQQRTAINEQVKVWNENSLIGAGMRSDIVRSTETLDGNIYFQLLAEVGTIGLGFYLLFCLNILLSSYRVWREIPRTHYWHKVFVSGGVGALAAFHVAGLYWATLNDFHAMALFVFWLAALSYMGQQYDRGLVPDDRSL